MFVDEVINNASQAVLYACGDDARCIFDASQTQNIAIGQDTMQQGTDNMETQAVASKWVYKLVRV